MSAYQNPFTNWPPKEKEQKEQKEQKEHKEHAIIRFYDPNTRGRDVRGRTLEHILQWGDSYLERSHDYIQVLFPLPEGSMFAFATPIINQEVMDAFRSRPELRERLGLALRRMLHFYGFEVSAEPEKDGEEQVEESKKEAEASEEAPAQAEEKMEDKGKEKQKEGGMEGDTTNGVDEQKRDEGTSTPPSQATMGFYIIRGRNWRQAFPNWAIRMDHNHLRITRILRCLRILGLQRECDAFFEALQRVFNDPNIRINDRSMMYWERAVKQPLFIAPDGERITWLKMWAVKQDALLRAEKEGQGRSEETKD